MSVEDMAELAACAETDGDPLAEQAVLDYLRGAPDLLLRHPDVLVGMAVAHGLNGAESLLEHQARVLRQRNGDLRLRLQDLVANARDNEALSDRLHALAVALLGARTATDAFAEIYQRLEESFRADCSAIRVFARPTSADAIGCGEFVGPEAAASAPMLACLHTERPLCGPLDEESASLLFDERSGRVRSAALVPLVAPGLRGVLAIGSFDGARFGADAGTHFLRQLGAMVAHGLSRFLDGDQARARG